jgi:hypothetical protein
LGKIISRKLKASRNMTRLLLSFTLLILALQSCIEKNTEDTYKEVTVSPRPENLQSPQKINTIEDVELRGMIAKNFQMDKGEYEKLITEFGRETAERIAFTKSFIEFAEIGNRDMHVADYYNLSRVKFQNDTLFLNFGARELMGGASFGFIITGGKYKGRFGHTQRCMTDKEPEVIVQYDSLSLNKKRFLKGDTIYGEYFIKALNKSDNVEFLSKGMFRSIIE